MAVTSGTGFTPPSGTIIRAPYTGFPSPGTAAPTPPTTGLLWPRVGVSNG